MHTLNELKQYKEEIAAKVHDSWWEEKKKQGFHAPYDCKSQSAKDAHAQDIQSFGHNEFPKFHKLCDKCHVDMYPYPELPEHIKDYDRVVLKAIIDMPGKLPKDEVMTPFLPTPKKRRTAGRLRP